MIPKTPSGTESNNSIRLLDGTDGIPAAGDPIVVLCPAPGAKGQIGATKDLIDYLLIGANPPLGLRPEFLLMSRGLSRPVGGKER